MDRAPEREDPMLWPSPTQELMPLNPWAVPLPGMPPDCVTMDLDCHSTVSFFGLPPHSTQ